LGASEIRQVIGALNALADQRQALQGDVEARILASRAEVEAENNRLSALMSDLAQSVLVCNGEGRILLYNTSAKQLFSQAPAASVGSGNLIGLGRSIFGLIDRHLIAHSLETIHHRIEQGDTNPRAHFVTTTRGGQFIHGHMAPVQDRQQTLAGFVLTMEDVTRRADSSSRRDILLQSLLERTRASIANIRAAVETILDYPDMDADHRKQFTQIIQEETVGLSAQLDRTLVDSAEDLHATWLLEEVLGDDLIVAVRRRCEADLGIDTRIDATDAPHWLKVDSYAIVQAITFIISRLQSDLGARAVVLRLQAAGRFTCFDIAWPGPPVDAEKLNAWERQPLTVAGASGHLTLREIVERHGGEIWCGADKGMDHAYVRLLLPATQPGPAWNAPVALESRPEYYDFDLFHQPGQVPELDQRRLAELTYTVFDTETTGLNPSGGDEIISIAAVRIVNGRLLRHEVFEQLIDPQRPISEESIRIHGLSRAMLRGQPSIEQVLPIFYEFIEDTVLVAHNAAFDLRFFQMKEGRSGHRLTQPVLDTLLLSPVVHPSQPDHGLEAIAGRLGVNIIGRHTALGDAIVTGEVFLKLVPLLAQQGICTLKEAREAAQRTYYARIKY
jgi:DNA polymerase-3 subunit epsilon